MNGTSSVEIAESGTNKGNEGKNSSNGEDQDDAEDSVSLNFRNEKNVDDPIEEQDIFGEMLFDQDLPFANPSSTMDGIAADVDSEGNYILANSNHLKLFNTNRNIIHENVTVSITFNSHRLFNRYILVLVMCD